jgi:hypothetical protein
MNLNKQFKFIRFLLNISTFKIKKITISNALQLRSHPDEIQVKLRTQLQTFVILDIHPHKNPIIEPEFFFF